MVEEGIYSTTSALQNGKDSAVTTMTTIPKPADPTQSFTATCDAWNRLVKLEDSSGTVAQYEYDGAKRRTIRKTYVSGQLDETRHFFYTEPARWQIVEERVSTCSNPDRQFVWGLRYIDDLILRDRDTDADGTLDERLYGIQDANSNVTSVAATTGSVQERYNYYPYGTPIVLTATFAPRGSSAFAWETTFAEYRWDEPVMLFHVRNRVLAAAIGNWLQRDPVTYSDGYNLYEYVQSMPVLRADPLGIAAILPITTTCLLIAAPQGKRKFRFPRPKGGRKPMNPFEIACYAACEVESNATTSDYLWCRDLCIWVVDNTPKLGNFCAAWYQFCVELWGKPEGDPNTNNLKTCLTVCEKTCLKFNKMCIMTPDIKEKIPWPPFVYV